MLVRHSHVAPVFHCCCVRQPFRVPNLLTRFKGKDAAALLEEGTFQAPETKTEGVQHRKATTPLFTVAILAQGTDRAEAFRLPSFFVSLPPDYAAVALQWVRKRHPARGRAISFSTSHMLFWGHIFGDLGFGRKGRDRSMFIAALTSQRTNLSPFTKGCREWGVSMRVSDFFPDPQGPPTSMTERDGECNSQCRTCG